MRNLNAYMQQPETDSVRAQVRICWDPETKCFIAEAIAPDLMLEGVGCGDSPLVALQNLNNALQGT